MKKKLAAVLMAAAMTMTLGACGSSGSSDSTDAASSEPTAEATEEAADETAEDTSSADTSGDASSEGEVELFAEDLDGSDVKVGFVVKSLADQYWTLVKAGAEEAADKYGADLTFIAPNSESDVQKQVENIETLTSAGVDVICVAPSNDETVLPALQNAVDSGIQVIAVDTDSTLPDKAGFIGTGNKEAAKIGAVWAGEQVGEGAKAIVLRGRLGDATHDAREEGITEGLAEAGVEVLEVQAADSTEEKGMQVAENLLNKYEDVSLIITTADSMATGAMNAVAQGGYSDVKVMGFDGTIPGVQYVTEGKWLGTTAQSPYAMGVLGVENAIKLAHGEEIPVNINSGQTVVGPDNCDDFLADLKAKAGE